MPHFALPSGRAFESARASIHDTDEQTLDDMMAAARIAAPGGREAARGEWVRSRLKQYGLTPTIDEVGNVIATAPGPAAGLPAVTVMAHLDTVFPVDTPLDVQRAGARLVGPGIADNARGLAGMIALVRALAVAGWPNRAPLTFVASVGEEGAGDLRGAKHYMKHVGQNARFIALDGAGATRVIYAGVGSRRLRARYVGTGGHSWSDFGAPNAIHAAGRAITRLTTVSLPERPRTTVTVGRMAGGTSVNAIPAEAWLELDLRSEALTALRTLEESVRTALNDAAREEDPDSKRLHCEITVFGDRPAGVTSPDHPLVQLAIAATRQIGLQPELASSSTDANVAMAAGVPAIAIGAGGDGGGTHTLQEWYTNTNGALGLERALMIVLGAATPTRNQI